MTETLTALLVEDDDRLARLLAGYLERHGVVVTIAGDGRRGLDEALRGSFDVVLLDLMLPGLDGLDVCRRLRDRSDVPILVITARDEEADQVLGLELGADDYVVKPFSPRALLARIRAVLRRARGRGPEEAIVVGPLRVEPAALRASVDGREIALTAYELAILRVLAERAGRVLGREQLMELAGGDPEQSFDRSIDVHISRLRAKLGEPLGRRLIKTVRGAGYVLAPAPEDEP